MSLFSLKFRGALQEWGEDHSTEPPTLTLNSAPGLCSDFPVVWMPGVCSLVCIWSQRQRPGLGPVISRRRPGWPCRSKDPCLQMLASPLAHHCCPQGCFLGLLFQWGLSLFRPDEHQSLRVTEHEVQSGPFDWRLREEGLQRGEIRKPPKLYLIKYLPS